jgi:hypothetical protein
MRDFFNKEASRKKNPSERAAGFSRFRDSQMLPLRPHRSIAEDGGEQRLVRHLGVLHSIDRAAV